MSLDLVKRIRNSGIEQHRQFAVKSLELLKDFQKLLNETPEPTTYQPSLRDRLARLESLVGIKGYHYLSGYKPAQKG